MITRNSRLLVAGNRLSCEDVHILVKLIKRTMISLYPGAPFKDVMVLPPAAVLTVLQSAGNEQDILDFQLRAQQHAASSNFAGVKEARLVIAPVPAVRQGAGIKAIVPITEWAVLFITEQVSAVMTYNADDKKEKDSSSFLPRCQKLIKALPKRFQKTLLDVGSMAMLQQTTLWRAGYTTALQTAIVLRRVAEFGIPADKKSLLSCVKAVVKNTNFAEVNKLVSWSGGWMDSAKKGGISKINFPSFFFDDKGVSSLCRCLSVMSEQAPDRTIYGERVSC